MRGPLETAHEQERLVVKLTSEAAGCAENLCQRAAECLLRTGSDESVQALDTELLSALISDLKDAIGGDDKEIAGGRRLAGSRRTERKAEGRRETAALHTVRWIVQRRASERREGWQRAHRRCCRRRRDESP